MLNVDDKRVDRESRPEKEESRSEAQKLDDYEKALQGLQEEITRFESTKNDPGTGLQQQFEFTGRDVEPFEARTTHLQEVFSVETK